METVTNAASNVASVASRAIWGDAATKDATTTNETAGQEPVSGEVGDVKSGEPYDKGNEEPKPEPKSLTKTTSKEIRSSDPTVDIPSTSKSPDPFAAQKVTDAPTPTPTETVETTKIEPLQDAKKGETDDFSSAGSGISGLAKEVKTGSDGTGAEEGVKKLNLGESREAKSSAPVEKKDTPIAAPATPSTATKTNGSTPDSKEKLSLKDKIKAKLHKHDKH